jgi:hypothetical protein
LNTACFVYATKPCSCAPDRARPDLDNLEEKPRAAIPTAPFNTHVL